MNEVLPKKLFIGGWSHAGPARNAGLWVVTVAVDSPFVGDAKYDLIDGPGNNPMTFLAAVQHCVARLNEDRPMIVHCVSGRSRCAAVVCTALADYMDVDFNDAYDIVKRAKDDVGIHPALVELGITLQEKRHAKRVP